MSITAHLHHNYYSHSGKYNIAVSFIQETAEKEQEMNGKQNPEGKMWKLFTFSFLQLFLEVTEEGGGGGRVTLFGVPSKLRASQVTSDIEYDRNDW